MEYALQQHLPGCVVAGCSGALDCVLQLRNVDAAARLAGERLMEAALERLGKQLRGLKDIALKVEGGGQMWQVRLGAQFGSVRGPVAVG